MSEAIMFAICRAAVALLPPERRASSVFVGGRGAYYAVDERDVVAYVEFMRVSPNEETAIEEVKGEGLRNKSLPTYDLTGQRIDGRRTRTGRPYVEGGRIRVRIEN